MSGDFQDWNQSANQAPKQEVSSYQNAKRARRITIGVGIAWAIGAILFGAYLWHILPR